MVSDNNQMKYKLFFFCLDDAYSKNKKMDANIEKLKGTLKKTKTKITK